MSKAVIGAAELVGAVALLAVASLTPAGIPMIFATVFKGLLFAGLATEAAAVAAAFTQQQGQGFTTHQAAGLRKIIYGTQRVLVDEVYQSTTGAAGDWFGNYVYNKIGVIATHQIDGIQNLFLDGNQVYFRQDGNPANVGCGDVSNPPTTSVTLGAGGAIASISASGGSGFANVAPTSYRVRIVDPTGAGSGAEAAATLVGGSFGSSLGPNLGSAVGGTWTVHIVTPGANYSSQTYAVIQGKYTIGGTARSDQPDPSQPGYGLGYGIGPNGQHYNFDGKVFFEPRFGDQGPSDYMSSLSANDSTWPSTAHGLGLAYCYVGIGYDTTNLPNGPQTEVRLTVNGKNDILDPRTGLSGFTYNWALQVADVLSNPNPMLGLGDVVNQAQLIAAANVCDELVSTSQGDEANWAQSIHYDTATSPGEVLSTMMPTAQGRLSYIGGEWYIWPAYWQGPSISFGEGDLAGEIPSWNPYRDASELINCVNGTYIAPRYPYNTAGNLYDKNGWYYGSIADVWPFEFQPTNYPQYARDTLHGYGSAEDLIADGGVTLPYELTLRGCLSVVQAQRAAKVALMRNRFQGSGNFPMKLYALQAQETDVMEFTFPLFGWANRNLEIVKMTIQQQEDSGQGEQDKAPAVIVMVNAIDTDSSIYAWSSSEELTPYDLPAGSLPASDGGVAAPTSLAVSNSAVTPLLQNDGTGLPRLVVSWTAPADAPTVTAGNIQVQWRDHAGVFEGGAWIDAGNVSGGATLCVIHPASTVAAVDVQVRSVRHGGQASAWVGLNNLSTPHAQAQLTHTQSWSGSSGTVASSMTDLPGLGASTLTFTTNGNPVIVGAQLFFSAASSTPNVPISVQIKMDGGIVYGPVEIATDINGNAILNVSALLTPTPSAGAHAFEVMASTPGPTTVTFNSGDFQLVETP